jgi:hypothetical protein
MGQGGALCLAALCGALGRAVFGSAVRALRLEGLCLEEMCGALRWQGLCCGVMGQVCCKRAVATGADVPLRGFRERAAATRGA